ncbi:MAG: hypothetical protein ACF8QF_02495 [Phycisphaerales bacterium]
MRTTLRPIERRAIRAGALVFVCAAPPFAAWLLAREALTPSSLIGAAIATFVVVGMLGATVTTMMLLVASLHGAEGDTARHCAHCDYDLTGAPDDRCPECGAPTTDTEPRMLWKP